jgi:2-hydroxy-3-oxopropionate reductase
MANHLRLAGHDVIAYDTDQAARSRATDLGLVVVESLQDFADREIIGSSLPDTPNAEEAYRAKGGIFDVVSAGTICVDLSTISVAASRAIAAEADERGIEFLDAPVSGAPVHSQEGVLVVMVGGSADTLERARPAIEPFAAKIDHIGPNGAGLQLKLVTNRLIATYLTVIGEAIVGMESVGLDVEKGIDVIRAGVVPKLLDFRAQPMVERDYTPKFTVDLMRKDMRLAAEALPQAGLASLAREIYEQVSRDGYGAEDPAAIMRILERSVSD